MKLSGWGRFPTVDCTVHAPRDEAELVALTATGEAIARGNGRAYGDSALNAASTLSMRHFDHMLGFDAATGQLVAEAGVLLADIIAAFLPRGWFPAVTPGTRFVTVGGIIAADVHGKNHHRDGSLAGFIDWIDLLGGDGTIRRCSRTEHAELFEWTIGGMGLTGIIVRAAMRLRAVETGWIRQTMIPAANLDAALAAFEAAEDATYSVAWVDCLARGSAVGRSLVMLGEHASLAELTPRQAADPFAMRAKSPKRMPLDAPGFLLNRFSVTAFNRLYHAKGKASCGTGLVGWQPYFYPLDAILEWNRIYGKRGFMQFQTVLPPGRSRAGLAALLEATATSGSGSFLAVLKRMGPGRGGISFPMDGHTLTLDFPVRPDTLALMERLDAIALGHGGRFYLAKDARMSAATLARSDPRMEDFRDFRATAAPGRFGSAQSQRLDL